MSIDATQVARICADTAAAIRAVWDRVAESGDRDRGDLDATEAQRRAWSHLLARLFPPAQPLNIVDMGCGTGFIALALAELGHTVTGVDHSAGMLRACRANADRRGLTTVRLLAGEAERPPDTGSVDAVVSRYLLWTLPRPEAAVRAWANLIRPGGRVVGIDALQPVDLVRHGAHREYPAEVVRRLPLLHAGDLEPVRNAWLRAELGNVMVEELGWIDQTMRSEVPMEMRPTLRRMNHYLVEGTRIP